MDVVKSGDDIYWFFFSASDSSTLHRRTRNAIQIALWTLMMQHVGTPLGRIVVELRADIAPLTAGLCGA